MLLVSRELRQQFRFSHSATTIQHYQLRFVAGIAVFQKRQFILSAYKRHTSNRNYTNYDLSNYDLMNHDLIDCVAMRHTAVDQRPPKLPPPEPPDEPPKPPPEKLPPEPLKLPDGDAAEIVD